MLSKEILRLMAEAERMMDEGTLPFVMAPSPSGIMERFAVNERLMQEYGLKQGQTINSLLRDALIEDNLRYLNIKLRKAATMLHNIEEEIENEQLEDNFDFRKMMDE